MKRALCVLLVVLMIVPLSPTPAHAGCCDDFWGCLGAVVTAGLSCAVQEAIEAIDKFVKSVKAARDAGKAEMEAAFAEHKAAADEAAAEAKSKMEEIVQQMDKAKKDAEKANRDMMAAVTQMAGAMALQQGAAGGAASGAAAKTGAAGAPAGAAPGAAGSAVSGAGAGSGAAAKTGAAGAGAGGAGAGAASGATARNVAGQSAAAKTGAAGAAAGGGAGGAAASAPAGAASAAAGRTTSVSTVGLEANMPLIKTGDPGRIKTALNTGEKEVANEAQKMANQKKALVEQQAAKAKSDAAVRVNAMQGVLNAVFLVPLAGIVSFFIGDPITLVVSIAVMAVQLNNVKKALDDKMDPEIQKAQDKMHEQLAEMEKKMAEHSKERDRARRTAELMQKLERTKLEADLQALEKHLGIKPPASVAISGAALQPEMLTTKLSLKGVALATANKERTSVVARKLRTDLDEPILMSTNFKKPVPPASVAQFRPRVTADLENHFRGRTGVAVAQKRDELIAEARKYFERDPKTLAAVEQYLREQAATRGAR